MKLKPRNPSRKQLRKIVHTPCFGNDQFHLTLHSESPTCRVFVALQLTANSRECSLCSISSESTTVAIATAVITICIMAVLVIPLSVILVFISSSFILFISIASAD